MYWLNTIILTNVVTISQTYAKKLLVFVREQIEQITHLLE